MPIFEGYGLTETAPFASYNHRLQFVPGSIGTPVDLVEMKIVDPETGQTCGPGEPGEIAIRGPNVMLGYWNRPEETAAAIRDGWFYSGDIGEVDERGYFYIVDRLKDMIVVGGRKSFRPKSKSAHGSCGGCGGGGRRTVGRSAGRESGRIHRPRVRRRRRRRMRSALIANGILGLTKSPGKLCLWMTCRETRPERC